MFLSTDDANMRLSRTIIRKAGIPIYVSEFTSPTDFRYYELLNREQGHTEEASLTDEDVDIKPVPLGYVNFQGQSHYLSRQPRRRYKQGLDVESLHAGRHCRDRRQVLFSQSFIDTVMGNWPSFEECHQAVNRFSLTSLAFDREWAVGMEGRLLYKGDKVGSIGEGVPSLKEQRFYLRESLEEAMQHG